MNDEWSVVLVLGDRREGMRAHFKDIGDIGTVTRVIRYASGHEEFLVDLGNACQLRASATHFEEVQD